MTDHHTLFPERPRDDPSIAEEEPTWCFLDRVDDPVFDRVRRLMNAWFERYPAGEREELRARLSSGDDVEFHAAWFELYLHELHRHLGLEVVPHPALAGVTTRPDFRLARDDTAVLLEATIIGNRDDAGRARRIARVVAAVNRTRSDDFTLFFEIEQEGPDSPPMRDVRRRLERWLASLTWAEVRAEQEHGFDMDALPTRTERVGEWEFSFKAWPRKQEKRGRPGPAISAGPSDSAVWNHGGTLFDRLEQKASKYGTPTEPVIIAVRMDRLGVDGDDVLVALLGPSIGHLSTSDPPTVVPTGRRGTGFFRHESGRSRNRHVAGVLFSDGELRPWSVARRAPALWLHPDPTHELPDGLPWQRVDLRGAEPQITEGTFDPAAIFDLPDIELFEDPAEWPGMPFESSRESSHDQPMPDNEPTARQRDLNAADDDLIDLDRQDTWPEATRRWAEEHADSLVDSTEFLADLAISLEQEDELRQTFGPRKLLAYHNTRLLPHEADAIRTGGLRLLDEQLVRDRIADAIAQNALPDAARRQAEAGNVYAIRNEGGRAGQICFVIGRTAFDEEAGGCEPLLRYWGGEAIRGGPGDVPALATVGAASIVVAKLNLTRRHNDPYSRPELAKLVGSLLGLARRFADVHYPCPVPGRDILAIWRPGDPEYDRHTELPW